MVRFARRCALALIGVGAACASPRAETAHVEAKAVLDLSITPASAEVWGWDVDVGGVREGAGARLVSCRLEPGDAPAVVDADGARWSARVHLVTAGRVAAACVDDRGMRHTSPSANLVPMLRDGPTARVRAEVRDGEIVLDGTASAPSEGTPAALTAYAWTEEPGGIPLGSGARLRRPIDAGTRNVTFRLRVRDARGREDEGAASLVAAGRERVLVDARGKGGPSARDAVIYGVVPRLFGAPPLRAVTAHLDDLADLGVTALWLSPVFETLPEEYGYAVTDYMRVRRDYGTGDDLAALVEGAHRRGLRVILDFVPNHTSAKHRYFVDAEAHGRSSHYFGFYERDANGVAVHYFDWERLPNLSYDAEVARWMLAVTEHWMTRFHVDGFRVDAAWGVTQRSPAFWDAWREEVRRRVPEALLVAEASAREAFYGEHGFDAAYDWTDALGKAAWEHAFDDLDAAPARLDEAARAPRTRPMRFLENNDTGERFVTRHGVALTRLAAAALLTMPGIPALFTGEERGAEYDPYARLEPLEEGDPHALRPWYRALIAIRRETGALRGDVYARLGTEPSARVLAYARRDDGDGDAAIVVLRFDARPAEVRIALREGGAIAPRAGRVWRDRLTGDAFVERGGALRVASPAWSARILVPSP